MLKRGSLSSRDLLTANEQSTVKLYSLAWLFGEVVYYDRLNSHLHDITRVRPVQLCA